MFVTDKLAALAQIRRVAGTSGRMVARVWQGLARHPFYLTRHRVIEQRHGVSAPQDIFSSGRAEELLKMALSAGFARADVEPMSMTARFPSAGKPADQLCRATTLMPAVSRWPIATSTWFTLRTGTNRSTCEPKRIIPTRCPHSRDWPSLT